MGRCQSLVTRSTSAMEVTFWAARINPSSRMIAKPTFLISSAIAFYLYALLSRNMHEWSMTSFP